MLCDMMWFIDFKVDVGLGGNMGAVYIVDDLIVGLYNSSFGVRFVWCLGLVFVVRVYMVVACFNCGYDFWCL